MNSARFHIPFLTLLLLFSASRNSMNNILKTQVWFNQGIKPKLTNFESNALLAHYYAAQDESITSNHITKVCLKQLIPKIIIIIRC